VPLAAAQLWLSHALPTNVLAYGAYMPHDMPPTEARGWLVSLAAALGLLAAVYRMGQRRTIAPA
jgi:hypothetical protein